MNSQCGSMNKQSSSFYGKYRGVVSSNNDPHKIGRLRAKVENVYGDKESGWALPSVPYAGEGVGLFLIPPVGALVWIEFENGNPDYPIWTGCFWGKTEDVPVKDPIPAIKVLKTKIATITINDSIKNTDQYIEITNTQGASIKLNGNTITINNGQASIKLNGKTVSINNDGLEVT